MCTGILRKMTNSSDTTRDPNPAPDGADSPLGSFAHRVIEVKRAYPDLAAVTADTLFLAFLLQFAGFGVFAFGPITIDVRLVEQRYAQTYVRRDAGTAMPTSDPSTPRFYRTLAREVAKSGALRPDELHFLLAFMRTPDGLAADVFGELAVTPESVEAFARSRATGAPAANPSPPAAAGTSAAPERLYSPEEAAEYLGVHVQTVRVWIRQGKLPARRILGQRALRIRQSDLTHVLEPLDSDTL